MTPRRDDRRMDLAGVVLPDARTGETVDLGAYTGVLVAVVVAGGGSVSAAVWPSGLPANPTTPGAGDGRDASDVTVR